jgi:MerR family transcriptional regulator, light-induced transcriptional regulator
MNDRPTGPMLHPVQVVMRRTGLSPELLRTWERRYAVVRPQRSPGGRRLYSEEDIERLRLLRRAIGLGWSIGQVARQETEALRSLVMGEAIPDPAGGRESPEGPFPAEAPLDECMSAIETLDASALERALSMAVVSVGRSRVVEGLVVPLMREVGKRWHDGTLRIANEHLASTVLSAFLSAMRSGSPPPETLPGLLVTTPAGQIHELGALAAAVIASLEEWRVFWIGANLPASEIAHAASRLRPRAVALSITHPADDPELPRELLQLAEALPPGIHVLAGGDAALAYRETLHAVGAVILRDLPHFRATLASLKNPDGR